METFQVTTQGRPHQLLSKKPCIFLILLGFCATALMGCHAQRAEQKRPVVVGVPGETTEKVSEAKSALIDSVAELGLTYDETVCAEKSDLAQRSDTDHALSEATLEVRRAVSSAREEFDGGDTDGDDSIIMFEDEAPRVAERGGWDCMQVEDEPKCVRASASSVSRLMYDYYIDEYNMNPVTAGDTMEALAAEIEWGAPRVIEADSPREAFKKIREDCREDPSPLVRFFEAASDFSHREVRADVGRLEEDFVGEADDVCAALPRFYEGLMGELRADLERRTRTKQCRVPQWDPVWD
ncbi:MAG: hypothetical protein ACOCV2_04660 [Persicimonas sp.]